MKIDYVLSAYLVFALVMAWDFVAPRIKLARVRRAVALRARRDASRRSH